ncbi:MAG: helix-turn-helix domain-containing protein [Paludibacteraceae bacterium]
MISVNEAAKYLGIGKSSVFRLVAEGKITCCRIGTRILFKQEWLEEFIKNNMQGDSQK